MKTKTLPTYRPLDLVAYDKEWIALILKAKQSGLSPEEVKQFLRKGALKSMVP